MRLLCLVAAVMMISGCERTDDQWKVLDAINSNDAEALEALLGGNVPTNRQRVDDFISTTRSKFGQLRFDQSPTDSTPDFLPEYRLSMRTDQALPNLSDSLAFKIEGETGRIAWLNVGWCADENGICSLGVHNASQ